ncbi:hypothetical protein NW762_010141 [Fusarium torreyae]|uniref:NmrA-like domain-containing protein n=1 Tax=Fusarium torreyae TaxID=1237075 RepID=A0A9W8RUD2_9HYPO|nr:hypothetical protein NW762_010141 [Fusarium torreyae]
MPHNILITGASGYLGGDLLAELVKADLPEYGKLLALVRSLEQAEAVRQLGAQPLTLDIHDEVAVREAVLGHEITVIYFLVDAVSSASQKLFINALGELKKRNNSDVHFLHVLDHWRKDVFESFWSTDRPETERRRPRVVHRAESSTGAFTKVSGNGKGGGFGNPISIQTVAIVQAAKALRRVYRTDSENPTWPVCHIADNTSLYIQILRTILSGHDPGHGKYGYYLASSGSVPWNDIYNAFAKALAGRGVVDDAEVHDTNDEVLQKMANALDCPKDFVAPQLGGRCTFTAEHGRKIGWRPAYTAENILATADEEVDRILQHSKV